MLSANTAERFGTADPWAFRRLRDALAHRITKLREWDPNWQESDDYGSPSYLLGELQDELADAANVDEISPCIDALYDWADANRVLFR